MTAILRRNVASRLIRWADGRYTVERFGSDAFWRWSRVTRIASFVSGGGDV